MGARGGRRNTGAVDQNVRAVKRWEAAALEGRSLAERFSDWITYAVATGPVVVGHVVWFTGWIIINAGGLPGVAPFDPFPFPLLTMVVSLEAIFLSLFVLGSQNRLSTQSDKRADLNLQVDLLEEREMTAVLHLLQDIAQHLHVKTNVSGDQILELGTRTDIYRIAGKLEGVDQESKPAQRTRR